MEELDSVLFRIPELVDYRATWNGKLFLEVSGTLSSGEVIQEAVKGLYPNRETCVCMPEGITQTQVSRLG